MSDMGARCQEAFGEELGWIVDAKLRDFVVESFRRLCPVYFWERGASKSTKYHPTVMNRTPGGLVQHSRYVAWWGREFSRAYDSDGSNRSPREDLYIAAGILHDMMKDGDPALAHLPERQGNQGSRLIGGCHGIDCANALFSDMFGGDPANLTLEYKTLLYMVASHMGVWTTHQHYRPMNLQDPELRHVCMVFHAADYAASRRVDTYFEKLGVTFGKAA